ncbi:MAG TPA: exonuclease domain-containing protein [Symbiobacteriaceae bacterium]|nr:exonuclease domain-containing protein [Symbiobacteriaceae bacterium]
MQPTYLPRFSSDAMMTATIGLACFVDTETTGFKAGKDEIVELGLILFAYDRSTGQVLGVVDEYEGQREPTCPIPKAASDVHGLTKQMLRGKQLDFTRINGLFQRAEFLVAHNARFDGPFLGHLLPQTAAMPWLCSMNGVDWRSRGFQSKGLQNLLQDHGVTPEKAHRALADARAALTLLARPDEDGLPYFRELVAGRRETLLAASQTAAAKGLAAGQSTTTGAEGSTVQPKHRTLTVQFGRSTSAKYLEALELAKKAPTFDEVGEGKNVLHRATYWLTDISSARDLLTMVSSWKTTSVLVDGEVYPISKVMSVMHCFGERARSYRPDRYCFGQDDASDYNDNDFGCRQCRINLAGWEGLKGYGTMNRTGAFQVNKGHIIHEISRSLEAYQLCPALQLDDVLRRVEAIPDVINPKTHKDWEYVTDWQDGKDVAVAVRRKKTNNGNEYVVGRESQSSRTITVEVKPASKKKPSAGCAVLPIILILVATVTAIVAD